MKKILTLLSAAVVTSSAAFGQEAFKHVGLSVEAGTTGLGVNLSYPLLTDHIVLTLGYNFPVYTIKKTAELSTGYVNGKVGQVNSMIADFNNRASSFNQNIGSMTELGLNVSEMQLIDPIEPLQSMNADLNAKLNFGNFKAMLEIYPTQKSYFHFTLGVMVGNGDWMNISAAVDQHTWGTYLQALSASEQAANTVQTYNANLADNNAKIDEYNAKIDQYNQIPGVTPLNHVPNLPNVGEQPPVDDAAAISLNGQLFVLDKTSNGQLDIALKVKKVKPYIGVGFGSSVPTKRRVGCQMEVGAYYQGKPILESPQENPTFGGAFYRDKLIDEVVKTVVRLQWYPQITLRFTGRLF